MWILALGDASGVKPCATPPGADRKNWSWGVGWGIGAQVTRKVSELHVRQAICPLVQNGSIGLSEAYRPNRLTLYPLFGLSVEMPLDTKRKDTVRVFPNELIIDVIAFLSIEALDLQPVNDLVG